MAKPILSQSRINLEKVPADLPYTVLVNDGKVKQRAKIEQDGDAVVLHVIYPPSKDDPIGTIATHVPFYLTEDGLRRLSASQSPIGGEPELVCLETELSP
jgi:hypothetical protein